MVIDVDLFKRSSRKIAENGGKPQEFPIVIEPFQLLL